MGKLTEAQKRAQKKYEKKNPLKTRIQRYRTTARTFVRHYATKDDMAELQEIFENENDRSDKNLKEL